jgi:hypothetical protein
MDYQRIYNQIIERAQNRKLEGYKERHHIIPKCMGGSNDKSNLVDLTAREHFICHMLLCEIHPDENKLVTSLWLMVIGKKRKKENQYLIGSRIYESLKIKNSLNQSKIKKGRKLSEETKQKMRQAKLGKKLSDGHKQKMRKPKSSTENMSRPKSEETKEKIRQSMLGQNKNKMSDETKRKIYTSERNQKISDNQKGIKKPKAGFGSLKF